MGASAPSFIQKVVTYFFVNRRRIIPFLFVGGTAFLINWGLFRLLLAAGMGTRIQVFLAFFISMELSIIYNFFLQYRWTWKDTQRLRGQALFKKMMIFHGALGVGMILRTVLFPVGQVLQIQDDLNLVIGVGAAALIDFFLYNKVVFKKTHH